ncbi:peptidase S8/S53 domain-containing protein [Ampelomyces quisqualis]|uniref:Peptidase S8/S53 domain-containing protein n=1 Tax=Ampelomyces quisqualis TaxID=50730 RepID=A0A6A5Q7K7_AMPQU|nr:peptidase S8/S53 domain-containing protein [Ampelomyces quisqualis]
MLFSIFLTLASVTCGASRLSSPRKVESRAISGRYIVKLRDDMGTLAVSQLKASLTTMPSHAYSMNGFTGFAGVLTAEEKRQLKTSDKVEYIEEDAMFHTTSIIQQKNATWGISRLSSLEPDSTTYTYDDSAGKGTCAYIMDTGIYAAHPDFESRATALVDLSGEDNNIDGDGHGTHVAGTIGSKTYGVAKKTKLYSIKVLDSSGSGSVSTILSGFQYAIKNRTQDCPKGSVLNLSLGGPKKKSIDDAAKALVQSGVFVAVAAGNEIDDVASSSPAGEPSVCTVGATNQTDEFAYFSNYGPGVDILAPGVDILSTYLNGSTDIISGTSMSSPHIAGLGAYLLGAGLAEVDTLCETIQSLAAQDAITEVPEDTANLLAYNGAEQTAVSKH